MLLTAIKLLITSEKRQMLICFLMLLRFVRLDLSLYKSANQTV